MNYQTKYKIEIHPYLIYEFDITKNGEKKKENKLKQRTV